MKTQLTILSLITVGALAIALADEHTDKGHVAVKHSLTLEGAKQVGEAAAKFAKDNGAGPSIAVVDDGGYLLYLSGLKKALLPERTFPSAKRAPRRSSRSRRRTSRIRSTKAVSR